MTMSSSSTPHRFHHVISPQDLQRLQREAVVVNDDKNHGHPHHPQRQGAHQERSLSALYWWAVCHVAGTGGVAHDVGKATRLLEQAICQTSNSNANEDDIQDGTGKHRHLLAVLKAASGHEPHEAAAQLRLQAADRLEWEAQQSAQWQEEEEHKEEDVIKVEEHEEDVIKLQNKDDDDDDILFWNHTLPQWNARETMYIWAMSYQWAGNAGVALNRPSAVTWLQRAAVLGHPSAQAWWGVRWNAAGDRFLDPQQKRELMRWWQRLASTAANNAWAQRMMGLCSEQRQHDDNDNHNKDHCLIEAVTWYNRAAQHGDTVAASYRQRLLGRLDTDRRLRVVGCVSRNQALQRVQSLGRRNDNDMLGLWANVLGQFQQQSQPTTTTNPCKDQHIETIPSTTTTTPKNPWVAPTPTFWTLRQVLVPQGLS